MKLKYSFEPVDMGDEIIMVPVGNNADQVQGVLKLNKSGQKILKILENDISKKEIVDILVKEYENDRIVLEDYVNKVVKILQDNDLLDE